MMTIMMMVMMMVMMVVMMMMMMITTCSVCVLFQSVKLQSATTSLQNKSYFSAYTLAFASLRKAKITGYLKVFDPTTLIQRH